MPSQLASLCQEVRLYLAWNTVKAKGAGGGVDGVSVLEFEKEKRKQIPKLAEELRNGTWKPQPYLEIEVVKNKTPDEIRKLGVRREDWVNIYPVCSECYARIEYIPPLKKKEPVKIAVV